MTRLLLLALLACGNKPPSSNSTGSPSGSANPSGTACDAMLTRVADLYRAHLRDRDRDRARLDEAISDNTTMVMNDCVKSPDTTAACIAAARTVPELEARCLIPLDDEGTEGDHLAR